MKFLSVFSLILLSLAAIGQKPGAETKKTDTLTYNRWMVVVERDNKKNSDQDTLRIIARKTDKDQGKISLSSGFDLGYSLFTDNTDYARALQQGDVAPGVQADDLELRLGRSWNVNIWFVLEELPLIKKVVQLQYGLGLELNNYSFENRNTYFNKNPTYVYKGAENYKKAKLAADYLTIPLLLKFNLTPNRRKNPFTLAGGMSGGFLYSARFKTKINGDISKIRDNFELNRFKLSYVGEIGIGSVKLYGSYATRDIFRNELNITPYSVGIRFVD